MQTGSTTDHWTSSEYCLCRRLRGQDWSRFWNTEGLDNQAKELELYFESMEETIKIFEKQYERP